MGELTLEQKQFIAIANARKLQADKAEAEGKGMKKHEKVKDDPMGFINKGIAQDFLGAPVDATAAAMNLFETERKRAASGIKGLLGISPPDKVSEQGLSSLVTGEEAPAVTPFGGGESFARGFENVGINIPDRAPQSPLEHAAQIGGASAGFALPLAKGAQALSKAPGVTGKVAGSMNDLLVQNPLQSLAIEGGAVSGQGVARSVAEEQEYGPTASMVAELGGTVLGGVAASGPLQRLAVGGAKRALNPFTDATSMDRAANRLRQVTDDTPLSVKNIDKNIDTGLHPSAMTEDQGLMAMEQTIAAYDPALGTKMAKQTSDTIDNLMGALEDVAKAGKMSSVKKVLAANTKRTKAGLDARIEIAAERSRKALEDLGDVATEADISKIQHKELLAASDEATVQEKAIWDLIPRKAKIPTKSAVDRYKELMRSLPEAQKKDMPTIAKQLLGGDTTPDMIPSGVIDPNTKQMIMLEGPTPTGKLGSVTTVNELDGLYKVLGEAASTARKDSKFNTARIAEDLREAILEDMKHIKGDRATRESVGNARAFSKEKNKKFSDGHVGKILGTKKGSVGVDPELTLATGVGQGGIKGNLAAREIAKATDKDIGQLEAVQEFIKRKFLAHSMDDGVISPNKARDWIQDNQPLMDTYPHLRDQFRSARKAEDVSRSIKKSSEALRGKLDKPSVSKTAKILNAPVHEEVKNIFTSPDPEAAMRNVVNAVRRDKTGEATKGLRSGVAEYLINLMKSEKSFDVKNRPMVSGGELKTALTKESSRKSIEKVFTPKEMKNWDKMADTLILANRQQNMKKTPASSIIGDKQGYLTETLGRFGGVKAASFLSRHTGGGGSIQIPAMGGEMGKKLVRKLSADKAEQVLIDALTENPELLKALYMRKSAKNDKLFDLQWRKYLARSGARLTAQEAADQLTEAQ